MLVDRSYDRLDASGSSSGRGGGSPRPARSTWPHSPDYDPGIELFARIREGLIRGEHVDRMGMALWLYEYLQLRCYFTGPQAGTSVATYTHLDAAKVLNRSVRSIKIWMDVLVVNGYVTTAKVNHGLVVTVTKYVQTPSGTAKPSAGNSTPLGEPSAGNSTPLGEPSAGNSTPVLVGGLTDGSPQPDPSAVCGEPSAVFGKPSAVFGQPLIYVARAFRDSEKKERISLTKRGTSPPIDLSPLAVGAVPVDGTGVRVASRRASPSPWGLLTSDEPPKPVEPVGHVEPPVTDTVADTVADTVTDTVTDTVADEIPVSLPVVAKASPKPRVRKVVVPKSVVGVDGHGPVMSPGPVPEPVGAVRDAGAVPLGEVPGVPEASTAIVLVTRATVTDVTPVTPVTLARRRRTAAVPVTEASLVLVAKESTRQTQVIDLLRADPRLAAYSHLGPRDFAAIKRSSLTPAQIVEVYGGLCLGEWGSEWDQKHVRVDHAIGCWAQYQRTRDAVTQAERDIETLLAAHSVPWVMTERDRTLIRDVTKRRQSPLGAEEIVAAYEGLVNGTWGSDWLRSNVSITKAIESFGSYQASLRPRGHDPTRKKTNDQEWADIFAERDKLMPEGSVQ